MKLSRTNKNWHFEVHHMVFVEFDMHEHTHTSKLSVVGTFMNLDVVKGLRKKKHEILVTMFTNHF